MKGTDLPEETAQHPQQIILSPESYVFAGPSPAAVSSIVLGEIPVAIDILSSPSPTCEILMGSTRLISPYWIANLFSLPNLDGPKSILNYGPIPNLRLDRNNINKNKFTLSPSI